MITILFVDDEPTFLGSILRALRGFPFEVLGAASGDEAIMLMRKRNVDVLVSDIDMPGMTGLELVKIVRREFPTTVRMLLTGAGTMDRTLEAINEGEVHRFFTKPLDYELFQATISALVDRIEKLRRDSEADERAARRDEFLRWVEATFPGTLDVVRSEHGEVVVDLPIEDLRLLDRPSRSQG